MCRGDQVKLSNVLVYVMRDRGGLIISLDFELHWGVRDYCGANHPYIRNILGARDVIPRMLIVFDKYGIAATWAAVGFLFASNYDELLHYYPELMPDYKDTKFNPYLENIGKNEIMDPLHYAGTIINKIKDLSSQEIASHTFSHYYCMEDGSNGKSFLNDLQSAQIIAEAKIGESLKSLVLPRNQCRAEYIELIAQAGFMCYRGNQEHGMYQSASTRMAKNKLMRARRWIDSYIGLDMSSSLIKRENQVYNIPASRFLRPPDGKYLEYLKERRIMNEMTRAAQMNRYYHLWWHPHNFGLYQERALSMLINILDHYVKLRDVYGFRSLTMRDAARDAAIRGD